MVRFTLMETLLFLWTNPVKSNLEIGAPGMPKGSAPVLAEAVYRLRRDSAGKRRTHLFYRELFSGDCTGPSVRYTSCNSEACEDGKDFRAEQCATHNDDPLDGNYHKWIPYKGKNK